MPALSEDHALARGVVGELERRTRRARRVRIVRGDVHQRLAFDRTCLVSLGDGGLQIIQKSHVVGEQIGVLFALLIVFALIIFAVLAAPAARELKVRPLVDATTQPNATEQQ